MPEDMSDRMPEDLPVTKRKNVMVGMTRSKVILFALSLVDHSPWSSHRCWYRYVDHPCCLGLRQKCFRKPGGKYLVISNGGIGSDVLKATFGHMQSEEIEGYACDLYYKLITIIVCTK
jgi:hypothetical protein